MTTLSRRVVTGLNAEGKSCVIVDGPTVDIGSGGGGAMAWSTTGVPADNSDQSGKMPAGFSMSSPGTMFMVMEFAPDMPAFWHSTDTIDYIAMLEGEIVLALEAGEVTLRAGDVLVDRGVVHCWRNDSGKPARAAIIVIPAHPLGQ